MALLRATVLKDFRTNGLSTSDVSTGYQLGAMTTGQVLYAGLHLTAVSLGTTARMLVGSVQAATASGFGSPSTQVQFALSTAQGAEWATPVTAGPSTEYAWWRFKWALSTGSSTGGVWNGLSWMSIR